MFIRTNFRIGSTPPSPLPEASPPCLSWSRYFNFIQGRTQGELWIVGDRNIFHSISHYPFMHWQRSRRGQRSQQRVSAAIHCCFSQNLHNLEANTKQWFFFAVLRHTYTVEITEIILQMVRESKISHDTCFFQ